MTYKRASLEVLIATKILLSERYWRYFSVPCFVQAQPKSVLFIVEWIRDIQELE